MQILKDVFPRHVKKIKEEARRRIKLENYVLTHSILEVRTVVGNMGKVKEKLSNLRNAKYIYLEEYNRLFL